MAYSMLQKLHDRSGSFVIKAILAIIGASFVVFGLSDIVRIITATPPIAKVGRHSIGFQEFEMVYQRSLRHLRKDGTQPTAEELSALPRLVAEDLVRRLVMELEPQRLHLRAPRSAVTEMVMSMSAFQQDGVFKPELFHNALRYAGIRQSDLISDVSHQLLLQQLLEPLLLNAASLHAPYLDLLVNTLYERKTFEIALAPENLPIEKISENNLEAYLKDHADAYREPEKRAFTLHVLNHQAMKDAIEVSSEEIEQEFADHKDVWCIPEHRKIYTLVSTNAEDANLIKSLLIKKQKEFYASRRAGKSAPHPVFDLKGLMAKELPGVSVSDPRVLSSAQLPAELVDSVGRLETYGSFGPLKIGEQYVVYFVEEVTPSVEKSIKDKEVQAQLTKDVQAHKFVDRLETIRDEIEDGFASGNPEKVIEKYGLVSISVNARARSDLSVLSSQSEPLSEEALDIILKTVFEIDEGGESSLVDVPQASVIVHVNKVEKAHVPPLKKVRTAVEKAVKKRRQNAAAFAWLDQKFSSVRTEAEWKKAISESHCKTQSITFSRLDKIRSQEHPARKLFKENQMDMLLLFHPGRIEPFELEGGRVAMVRLVKTSGDTFSILDSERAKQRTELGAFLHNGVQQDCIHMIRNDIQGCYRVKYNKKILKKIETSQVDSD